MRYLTFLIPLFAAAYLQASADSTIPRAVRKRAAEALGLEIPDFQIDPLHWEFSSGGRPSPFQRMLINDPLSAPDGVRRLASLLTALSARPGHLILNAALLTGRHAGNPPPFEWLDLPAEGNALADSYRALMETAGREPDEKTVAALAALGGEAPAEAVVLFNGFRAVRSAYPWIAAGRESLERHMGLERAETPMARGFENPAAQSKALQRAADFEDIRFIYRGAAEIAEFLSALIESKPMASPFYGTRPVVIHTPLGEIAMGSHGDDVHRFDDPPLLILDPGGNDTYQGAYARAGKGRAVSMLIDLGGNDRYESPGGGVQGNGSAFAGFAAIVDLGGGNDAFVGTDRCFGHAFLGAALLLDEAGGTEYSGRAWTLGSGTFGMALLIDGGGNDRYEAMHAAQGYGGIGGAGVLLDAAGNDRYIAAATPAVFPSAQLPDRNHSASQGFGTGRYGPLLDGLALRGGIGILLDGGGDDRYEAPVFAQGAGYGFGTGILADAGGNDVYTASWYAQGSAAHQACGFLIDEAGNDRYAVSHYMAHGAATDLALGALADLAGDDEYHAGNAALGHALVNSIGLFADRAGSDRYAVDGGAGLGTASNERFETLRGFWPTIGLFFDLSGEDRYGNAAWSNGALWTNEKPDERAYGAGIDR